MYLAHSKTTWRSNWNGIFEFQNWTWFKFLFSQVSPIFNFVIIFCILLYLPWCSSWDYVSIYDGPSSSSDLIGRFCDNSPPPMKILSLTNEVLIYLKTDFGGTFEGFHLHYKTLSKFKGTFLSFQLVLDIPNFKFLSSLKPKLCILKITSNLKSPNKYFAISSN